jgi:hypothetical protein
MSDEENDKGLSTKTRVIFTMLLLLVWVLSVYWIEGVDNTDLAIQQVVSGADQVAIQDNFLYEYGIHAVSLGVVVTLISLWWSKAYDALRSIFAD